MGLQASLAEQGLNIAPYVTLVKKSAFTLKTVNVQPLLPGQSCQPQKACLP